MVVHSKVSEPQGKEPGNGRVAGVHANLVMWLSKVEVDVGQNKYDMSSRRAPGTEQTITRCGAF